MRFKDIKENLFIGFFIVGGIILISTMMWMMGYLLYDGIFKRNLLLMIVSLIIITIIAFITGYFIRKIGGKRK